MNTTLKEEVALLRSAVIGILGKDPEGTYREKLVREVFADLKRKPTRTFSGTKSFLSDVAKTN